MNIYQTSWAREFSKFRIDGIHTREVTTRSDYIKIKKFYTSKKKSLRLKSNQQNCWLRYCCRQVYFNKYKTHINSGIQTPGPQQIKGERTYVGKRQIRKYAEK